MSLNLKQCTQNVKTQNYKLQSYAYTPVTNRYCLIFFNAKYFLFADFYKNNVLLI